MGNGHLQTPNCTVGSDVRLQVLYLEDSPSDAKLALRHLCRDGFLLDADIVASREEFTRHLDLKAYDVVLADYHVPDWSGASALEALQQRGNDIPFILVTGALGDDAAVECIKKGAADYVLKDHLAQLPIAVRRALEEKALRKARQRAEKERAYLASIVESSDDAIIGKSPEGVIQSWNRGAEKVYGYSAGEAIGRSITLIAPPQGCDEIARWLARIRQGERIEHAETVRVRKDGRLIHVSVTISPLMDAAGRVVGASTIARDITGRKQAEEALQASERRQRAIYDSGLLGVICWNIDGRITDANREFLKITGYHQEDLETGRLSWTDITPPEYRHREDLSIAELKATGVNQSPFEKEYIRKDGTRVSVLIAGAMLDEARINGVAFVLDITERKRAEEKLRESESRFRALVTASSDVVYTMSPDWSEMRQLHGRDFIPDTETPSRSWVQQYIHPLDQSGVQKAIREAIRNKSIFELEHRVLRSDGSLGWTFSRAVPILDKEGNIREWFGAAADITRRKEVEIALRESETKLRHFVQHAPAAIAMLDREMRYLVVSQRWMSDYRLGDWDIHGVSHYEVFPEVPNSWKEIHQRCLAGAVESCEEDAFPRQDGSVDWLRWEVRPWRRGDDSIGGIIIFSELITDRKRAEAALEKRSEELQLSQHALEQKVQELARSNAELEQFAYIASHDLQEPLRTVASFAQLLERRYKGRLDANADDFIHFMVDGAARMQGLINDLLAFSRVGRRGQEFAPADCTAVLAQAVRNLETAIAESGASVTHAPLPTVPCDGAQLMQVFQNLVGNSLKFRDAQPPHVHVSAQRQPNEWVFSVQDNGIGIEPQYHARIFEVFQRLHNRTEYPGSGIGLAIAKKIVERHGGRIWVESQLHRGATFYFTLPA